MVSYRRIIQLCCLFSIVTLIWLATLIRPSSDASKRNGAIYQNKDDRQNDQRLRSPLMKDRAAVRHEFLPLYTQNKTITATRFIPHTLEANINLLNQKPMPFLEGYKNPCFWQQESYQEMCVNASRKQRADASLQEACRRSAPAEGVLTRLSCLPYFFLVGMPKSGSTDLMMRINAHPQAARVRKENHWFSRGRHTTGYEGCFVADESVIQDHDVTAPFNLLACIDTCREKHTKYTGVQKDGCRCFDDLRTQRVGEYRCNQMCRFNSVCGGENAMSVYRTDRYCGAYVISKTVQHYIDIFGASNMRAEDTMRTDNSMPVINSDMVMGDGSVSLAWDHDCEEPMLDSYGRYAGPAHTNAEYIKHVLPKAKVIFILRNPVTRLFSDYLNINAFTGIKDTDINRTAEQFHDYVRTSIDVMTECIRQRPLRSCVYDPQVQWYTKVRINLGFYAVFVKDFLSSFDRDSVIIVRSEDYKVDISGTLMRVFDFLNLESLSIHELQRIADLTKANQSSGKSALEGKARDMLPETRRILTDFYRPYNKMLAELLSDERFTWNDSEIS